MYRNYPAGPMRTSKHKDTPAATEHRSVAVADALDPKDRERIAEEAKEAAARVLAEFERKRGYR
jgi:hypothetical protein